MHSCENVMSPLLTPVTVDKLLLLLLSLGVANTLCNALTSESYLALLPIEGSGLV